MKRIINKIRMISASKGMQQTVLMMSGNYLSAFISAIAIIIISRSLGPNLFGEFSAAFSISMILSRLNDFGITLATQKFASQSTDKSETKSYIIYGYKFKILISILIIFLILPLSPYVTGFFKFSNNYIAPISIFFGILLVYYDQLVVSLLSTHVFFKASIANLTQALFKFSTAIFFSIFYPKSLLLFFFSFIIAPVIPLLFKQQLEPKWFNKISLIKITESNKTKFNILARNSAILVFITGIFDSVGILFVKYFSTNYEAGLLGGINRIALVFILVGVSLSQVLFNRVSKYKNKNDLDIYIKKSFVLSAIAIVSFVILVPFLPTLITFTIGQEYLVALNPLIVITASIFIYIISVPFTALFYSFDKDNYFSVSGIIQLFILLLGNYLLVPSYGIMGAGVVQLIARLITLFYTIIFALIVYKEKYEYKK